MAAIDALPPRLIDRSSSSSGSTPVADDAAVARERRRLVDDRCGDRFAHVRRASSIFSGPGSQEGRL
jgi:hypothetical protein